MAELRLALREINRARLRFALLASAVGLLVFLILFQQTLLGTLLGYFTGALENQSAEVVVYNDEARRNLAGSVVTPEQLDAVAAVTDQAEVGPLGQASFTVRAAGVDDDASIWGYRLGGPGEPTELSDGRLPSGDFEAVASDLDAGSGYGIGERVTVRGASGEVEIEVVGLAAESRFSVQPVLFVSYETWEAAVSKVNPDAPAIWPSAVLVEPGAEQDAKELAAAINAEVAGVEALERSVAVASAPGVSSVRQSFAIVLLLAFVVVTLVVGFFFLIITVSKLPAVALLKAMGYSDRSLVGSLLFQVGLVSLAGVAIGGGLLGVAAAVSGESFPIVADPNLVVTSGGLVCVLAVAASYGSVQRLRRVAAADAVTKPNLGGLT